MLVQNVNDVPFINDIDNPEPVNEDEENLSIIVTPTDADLQDELFISIQSSNELLLDSSDISIDIENAVSNIPRTITFDPKNNAYGESTITISITDGQEIVSKQFLIQVLPINDIPIIETISDVIMNEDQTKQLSISVSDPDYVSLEYEVVHSDNITATLDNDIINISIDENYFGNESLTLTVTDDQNAEASQTISIIIQSVNDAPVHGSYTDLRLPTLCSV